MTVRISDNKRFNSNFFLSTIGAVGVGVEMAMGTRNPMGFYPIRVRVWVNFHTHGFVNGHKSVPSGFMGTGLFL
jgi:hypothetical protein